MQKCSEIEISLQKWSILQRIIELITNLPIKCEIERTIINLISSPLVWMAMVIEFEWLWPSIDHRSRPNLFREFSIAAYYFLNLRLDQ